MKKVRIDIDVAPLRRAAYPGIGDQLDAMMKLADHMRSQGQQLPEDVCKWVDDCKAVKRRYPKPANLTGKQE